MLLFTSVLCWRNPYIPKKNFFLAVCYENSEMVVFFAKRQSKKK